MNRSSIGKTACVVCGLLLFAEGASAQNGTPVSERMDAVTRDLESARDYAQRGNLADAQRAILRAYLDEYELIESYYGEGAKYGVAGVAERISAGETAFHSLMRATDPSVVARDADALAKQMTELRSALEQSGVPANPVAERATPTTSAPANREVRTPELRAIVTEINAAAAAYSANERTRALEIVEHTYLEQFEPLESRLPRAVVDRIEKTIHLQLRPAMRRGAPNAEVSALLASINADLYQGDDFLTAGTPIGFTAFNSFAIIVREGLEAVLLIAALLAYLGAIGAAAKHRRQIYAGVAAGVVASIGTWFVARTLLPISGANRELIEGVTALIAVGVLLYVAHWLFQKTYIHDWKDYLRTRVGSAVTRGSAFAMAALAFAAVYREGFETVLFYQALAFESGAGPILLGFIPGALLILGIGVAIIRAGVKLPLRKVFTWTNAVLMYLAFVFIGKGLYNLQEAGVYSAHPLPLPDHPALRQLLGFYPVVETLAGQLLFCALLFTTYLIYRRRAINAPAPRSAPLPEPRAAARQA